jgi:hypothetical protein
MQEEQAEQVEEHVEGQVEEQLVSSIVQGSGDSDDVDVGEPEVQQNIHVNSVLTIFQNSHQSLFSGYNGLDIIENFLGKFFSPGCGPRPPMEMMLKQLLQLKGPSVAFCSVSVALATPSLFPTLLLADKKWSSDYYMHTMLSLDWLRGLVCGQSGQKQYRQLLKQPTSQHEIAAADFTFATPDVQMKKKCGKRSRKQDTPLVDTMVRRINRSSANKDGYMHRALKDTRATSAKKRKTQKHQVQEDLQSTKVVMHIGVQEEKSSADQGSSSCDLPPTPISVMRKVGLALGMEAADLTKEKFMTTPADKVPTDVPNE